MTTKNESVLIDGKVYEIPMPVACELLRLNIAIRAALANAKEQLDAQEVFAAIDSCEWSVSRILPSPSLTDEANRQLSWIVERRSPPFCDKERNRHWTGPTAIEALQKGKEAIKIMKLVRL